MDLTNVVIPVILSSITAFLTTLWFNHNKKKEEINCLRTAIKTELDTLLKIYEPRKIKPHPPKDGYDISIASLQSKYTTVFTENSSKIGMLDENTAQAVVVAYTRLSALMDTLRVYSKRWADKIANERHGDPKNQEIYDKDVLSCYMIAYVEQEITLNAVNDAIEKLSK